MKWCYVFLLLLSVLLFVGGPDGNSHRIYQQIWDTGHMVLFAGLIWVLLCLPVFEKRRWIELFLITTGFSLIIGFATEVVQSLVGRDFAFKDILTDLLGGYLGLLIVTAQQSHRHIVVRVAVYPLMLGIIAWVLWPVAFIVMDEYSMQDEFPILADFETPYELSRWENNSSSFSIVDNYFRFGSKSMRIDLDSGKYPGISMSHFPGDWRKFISIKFSVFSTRNENIMMSLKIYDQQHIRLGYKYSDRFNRKLILKPGWNDFLIPMEDVISAPANRDMNLSDIADFSLFLDGPQQPVTLYFDSLRLSSKH